MSGIFDINSGISSKRFNVLKNGGIKLSGQEYITTPCPISPNECFNLKRGVTIGILFKSTDIKQTGPKRIFSYSKNVIIQNFILGQEKKDFIFRLPYNEEKSQFAQNFIFPNLIEIDKRICLHVVVNEKQINVYKNGFLVATKSLNPTISRDWSKGCYFNIGCEGTGRRAWTGELYAIKIHNCALNNNRINQEYHLLMTGKNDYAEDILLHLNLTGNSRDEILMDRAGKIQGIIFKERFSRLQGLARSYQIFLSGEFQIKELTWVSIIKDIILNILAFFLISIIILKMMPLDDKGHIYIIAILFLLSLSIEITQIFTPNRSPALYDLMFNIIGTILGVRIFTSLITKKSLNEV